MKTELIPEANINGVIQELRQVSQHMATLAALLEKAQEHEDLQGKLSRLLSDPMLAAIAGGLSAKQEDDRPPPATQTTQPTERAREANKTPKENAGTERQDRPAAASPVRDGQAPRFPEPVDEPKPDLESLLPEEIRNPSPALRLKIFRVMSGFTYSTLARAAGLGKQQLAQFEQESQAMKPNHAAKLCAAMKLRGDAFSDMPMSSVLDLAGADTVSKRLKLLRMRYGCTQDEFAGMLGIKLETYADYERSGCSMPRMSRILMALKISDLMFADLFGEPSGPEALSPVIHGLTTAQKLTAVRSSRQMTQKELAERSGISMSHISNIESGRHNPSEKTINALAIALDVPAHEIAGEENTNLRTLTHARSAT